MNWKSLKDFCNNLPESELEKNVILWRESEAVTDIFAEQLEENNFIDPENTEEGCFGLSIAESLIKDNPDDYPNGMDYFKKVYDKGTPILHENF